MIAPYYQTDRTTLYHGDCLAVLPGLVAGSVDLILADLPYGTTACAWDSIIPLDKLWAEYKRVLKSRGAVVLTATQPFTSALVLSNPTWFKYAWVWNKRKAGSAFTSNQMPMMVHEDVLVFAPRVLTFNKQHRIGAPMKIRAITRRNGDTQRNRTSVQRGYDNPEGLYNPVSIIEIGKPPERQLHPTQKPVALGRYFVRTYSNPGDVVLDNTMGVGSFVVAAIEEGRRAIGIERAPDPTTADDYCAIARDRVLAAEAARGYAVPTEAARRPLQLGLAWEATA